MLIILVLQKLEFCHHNLKTRIFVQKKNIYVKKYIYDQQRVKDNHLHKS